jgi:hypothetical protein
MNLGEEFSLTQGLAIFEGRIGYSDALSSKQALAIDEDRLLEDDVGERLDTVFRHLNMAIAAVNQHAYLFNAHLPALQSLLPLLALPSAVKALKKEHEDEKDRMRKSFDLVHQRIANLEDRLHVGDITQAAKEKAADEKLKTVEDRVRLWTQKTDDDILKLNQDFLKLRDSQLKRVDDLETKIGLNEKQTSWKIDDCCQLLKLRPTEEAVVKIFEKEIEKANESQGPLPKKKGSDKMDSLKINLDAPTKEDLARIVQQLSTLENQ